MRASNVVKSRQKAHQQLDGVRISESPGLREVLRATRDFAAGDVVLLEMPLLVYASRKQLIKGYVRLSREDKAKVLDIRHMDLTLQTKPRYKQCEEYAVQMVSELPPLYDKYNDIIGAEELGNLISVSNFTAHAYDMAGQIYSELDVFTKPQLAIFHLGAKMGHACNPNIIYTSSAYPGYGAFVALKSIAEGDALDVSVAEATDPTMQRRERLLMQKDYFCECPRCTGPDLVSGIRCERSGCSGIKFGYHRGPNDKLLRDWKCDRCGDTTTPNLAIQQRYEHIMRDTIGDMFESFSALPSLARTLETMARDIERDLSPTHCALIELYNKAILPVRHYAITLSQRGDQRKSEIYRVRSAECGVQMMRIMECVTADCTKGLQCNEEHPPCMTEPVPLLWVGMDLLRTTLKSREAHFPFLEKYMSYLFSIYGRDDDDICAVEDMLRGWRERGGGRPKKPITASSKREDSSVQEVADSLDDWLITTPAGQGSNSATKKKKTKSKRRGRK